MNTTVVIIVGFFAAVCAVKLFSSKKDEAGDTANKAAQEPDPGFINDIKAASNAEELMQVIWHYYGWHYTNENESDAILTKIRSFKTEFNQDEWEAILNLSAPGSELERIAEENVNDLF